MKYLISAVIALVLLLCMNTFVNTEDAVVELPTLRISPFIQMGKEMCAFEPLELGVPCQMAPIMANGVYNLCFLLSYDGGVVELVSENEDVQLSWSDKEDSWRAGIPIRYRTYGFSAHISNSGYISANPIGSGRGEFVWNGTEIQNIKGYEGREYILTVKAYEASNIESPVITAELCLTQIGENDFGGSGNFSIELISYEMSETYAMELAS